MISYLSEWARALITLVMLSGFLELLLPAGSMRKYIRYGAGLVLVLLVVKPLPDLRHITLPPLETAGYDAALYRDATAEVFRRRVQAHLKEQFQVEEVSVSVSTEAPYEILSVDAPRKEEQIREYLGLPKRKAGDSH